MTGLLIFRSRSSAGRWVLAPALALAVLLPASVRAEDVEAAAPTAVETVVAKVSEDQAPRKQVEEAESEAEADVDAPAEKQADMESDAETEASSKKDAEAAAGEPAGESTEELASRPSGDGPPAETELAVGDDDAPGADSPAADGATEPEVAGDEPDTKWGPFEIFGETVKPGKTRRLFLGSGESLAGIPTETPVVVAQGTRPGGVLCVTAAIHGDEYNGIEIARRVVYDLDPDKLSGTLISVPLVNVPGFQRSSRYLPDRRDLNRFFPGNPTGSSASRLASFLFETIIRRCDRLVDLHTGSFHRTNLTQLRADVTIENVRDLAALMSPMPVLHSIPALGTLRRAAVDAGIPTVTMETGEPLRLEVPMVEEGVRTIDRLMARLGMLRVDKAAKPRPQSVFHASTWVRADRGGIFISDVKLGQKVDSGEQIGSITDAINNARADVYASQKGTVLGLASNQFVMPGFAVVRIGIPAHGEIPDLPSPLEVGQIPGEGELDEGGDVPDDALEEKTSSVTRDDGDPDAVERPE